MKLIYVFTLLFSISFYAQRSDFIHIDFKKADSVANLYKGNSLRNLPILTHKLTTPLKTEVEKFRAIYTWVSSNIENDYSSYLKISHKRKRFAKDRQAFLDWNTSITPKVFEKLLKERKTACTGYAYLIKEMASLAGFKCEIIDGFGRTPTLLLKEDSTPNHSWNSIEIDGKWYVCDATWSAGQTFLIEGTPHFKPSYFDGYFISEPELFAKNHFPITPRESQGKYDRTFTAFIEGPVIYKEAFIEPIIPVLPITMHNQIKKGESLTFKLKVPESFNGVIHLISNKGGVQKTINPKIFRAPNEISFIQNFEKKGLYDIHITSNNKLITTYVIKVK